MFKILTLNNIAVEGLRRLPRERYEVASEIAHPDAILLRSHNMHGMDIPETVAAVGRAGAGTNNIPCDELARRGVPVFNAPGANANAVKELVLGGLFMAARNLVPAHEYVRALTEEGDALQKAIEAGKKRFVGFELPGRTLGVIGLGAIGVEVANAAFGLGMKVIGFDPKITVERAWQLWAGVQQANTGHHHLLIDVDTLPPENLPLPASEQVVHFGGGQTETTIELSPGTHTLQMVLGDHLHIEAHQGTHVGAQRAVGGGHQDHVMGAHQTHHHLITHLKYGRQ